MWYGNFFILLFRRKLFKKRILIRFKVLMQVNNKKIAL